MLFDSSSSPAFHSSNVRHAFVVSADTRVDSIDVPESLTESFGEKETVRRSGRYSLSLIHDLNFVHRTKAGCYSACQLTKVTDADLASWFIKAWFFASGISGPMDRIAIANHPGLSFFDAPSLVATALRQGVLTMDRLSLSQDTVRIRD